MVAGDFPRTRATSLTVNNAGEGIGNSETTFATAFSPVRSPLRWGSYGAFSRGKLAKLCEGTLVAVVPESSDCEDLITPAGGCHPPGANSHGRGGRFKPCCAHPSVFETTLGRPASPGDDGQLR